MVKGVCPYCNCEIDLKVAEFAPSTHSEVCSECGKQYYVIDIPQKGIKAITEEDYVKKFEKFVIKN